MLLKYKIINELPFDFHANIPCNLEKIGMFSSTGSAYLLSVKSHDIEHKFFVKQSPYAQKEIKALLFIHESLKNTDINGTIPQLIKGIPSEDVVITEFFENDGRVDRSLIQFPFLNKYQNDNTQLIGSNIGIWLAKYQNNMDIVEPTDKLSPFIVDIKARLENHISLTKLDKKLIFERLDQLNEKVGELSYTYSHGDFTTRNILLAAGSIKVIDWEMMPDHPMPFLYDAHYFCITLHKRFTDWLPMKNKINNLISGFWSGYLATVDIDKHKIKEQWSLMRLIVLCMIYDRQMKALQCNYLYSKITRKDKFINLLLNQIKNGVKHDYEYPIKGF